MGDGNTTNGKLSADDLIALYKNNHEGFLAFVNSLKLDADPEGRVHEEGQEESHLRSRRKES